MPLPSMIRVDAVGRMDVVYDEISEALGEEPGYFDAAEFEENMSTHYGRMIHERRPDDHVRQPRGRGRVPRLRPEPAVTDQRGRTHRHTTEEDRCTRRTARSTSWSTATCTSGTPSPDNWVPGAEQYAKGWIECFHAYQGLGAEGDPLDASRSSEVLRGRPDEGRLRGRLRGRGDLPADVPEGVVQGRLQHHRAATPRWSRSTRASSSSTRRFDPRDGDAGLEELEENVERYGLEGRQALHRRVERRIARLEAQRPRGVPLPGEVPGARASRTSTSTRARRSGRWTRTRSTSPTSTTPRPTSRTSTSSSSTSGCRGSRTSASWRRRSPTSTPASPWSSAA